MLDQLSKLLMEELTKENKIHLMVLMQTIMNKLWNHPYREDSNADWRVEYLKTTDHSYDYYHISNGSQHPNLAFDKFFEVHDFHKIMQMCLNMFVKEEKKINKLD